MPSTPNPRCVRRALRVAATALLAVTATASTIATVGAAPVGDKRKEAAQIQDQIDATDIQIGGLADKLQEAEARRAAAEAAVAAAQAQILASKSEVHRIKVLVAQDLASLYRQTIRGSSDNFDINDANDLSRRDRYTKAQNRRHDELLALLKQAQEDLAARRDESQRARDSAATESDQINGAKAAFEAARADQQKVLDKVNGELAAAVAAEQARRAAAVQARFSRPPVPTPDVGPPNGSASQAIAYARAVLGAGYSTNPRMGPTYDCSGLTYMAWKAAGVIIPTVSGAQYAGLPHVSLDAVQPGDLIFYGPGGSSHVALYIGGGMIIDASSSQGQVTQRAIWGSPIGAARVT